MFYERDFIRFKEHTNKLQLFSQKVHNSYERRQIFRNYASNCSLHGFSYIFNKDLDKIERYFWAVCVALASIGTVSVCSMLSNKYSDRAVMTVVQNSQYPVFKIDFPAIGVCTRHRINWGRVPLALKKFLPDDANNETVEMFTSFVKRLDTFRFKNFDNFAGIENEPLHLINAVSVSKLAQYLSFRCEDIMYGTCMFSNSPIDCCKMFVPEKTSNGMCLVFNSVASPESRQMAVDNTLYPYKNSKNGEGSGLVFTVKRNISNVVPGVDADSIIDLMIKKPDQWTDWKTYRLRLNTNNEVILQPMLTETHEELKEFPLSFRNCLFDVRPHNTLNAFDTHEGSIEWVSILSSVLERSQRVPFLPWYKRHCIAQNMRNYLNGIDTRCVSQHEKFTSFFIPNLDYDIWNCKSQCHQDYIIRYCNCTIPLFFDIQGINARECTPADYICIYKNRDIFGNAKQPHIDKFIRPQGMGRGMICACPPGCSSLSYPIILNTIPTYNLSGILRLATRVDVYYQSEVIMKYLTTLKYSIWDLTGYFGGIVTLFVGASLLTGVEFIHFALLEIVSCLKGRKPAQKIGQGQGLL